MIFSKRSYNGISALIFLSTLVFVFVISFLLLFFIDKVKYNKGFNVYLPASDSYIFKDIEKSVDILISVSQDGSIFVNDNRTSGADLIDVVNLLTGNNKENALKLEIDKAIKYEDIINLANFFKYNGYQNLIFITD